VTGIESCKIVFLGGTSHNPIQSFVLQTLYAVGCIL